MKNIVLIGFMGTGKTTVGRLLAKQLEWSFVDLDKEIEAACGMVVSRIFDEHGEDFFRQCESEAIKRLSQCTRTVIATGGGAVLRDENIDHLRQCGILVRLKAQPEVIVSRVENEQHVTRPLLNQPDRLQVVTKLLTERQARYELADISVDTDNNTPDEVAQKIKSLCRIPDQKSFRFQLVPVWLGM